MNMPHCSEHDVVMPLEWQDNVENLGTITRLLNIGQLAAPAIGNPKLGNLLMSDGVVRRDIFWTHDTRHIEFANLEIDPNFLATMDHEIAIRQHLGHDGRDV